MDVRSGGRSWRRLTLGVVVVLCLVLSACISKPPQPLRVGTNFWPGYESLHLARSLGFYDQSQIKLFELTSATEVRRALRNGSLDVAALTLDETLALLADGVSLRVVLVMDFSNGGDALIARPGIDTLDQLRGRRVGVESTGVGALLLDSALQHAGLQHSDIELVPLTVDEQFDAYRTGTVDAVATFDPARTRILALGGNSLYDSSRIPGQIVDVLVVREEVLASHGEVIGDLVKGHFDALDYFGSNTQDALERMAPRMKITPQALKEAFALLNLPGQAENCLLLSGEGPPLVETARRLSHLMSQQALLNRNLDIDKGLVDAGLLPSDCP